MIAAGIEGGSKRRIEGDWDLADYQRQLDYWVEVAPPPNIGIKLVARAMGVEFANSPRISPRSEPETLDGPSIAEIAAMIPAPVAGGNTASASIAALKILKQKGGGNAGER